MSESSRTLVVLIGPPAVGKMSVGRHLSRLTGIPLFHNHLSIEAVLPVFEFGSPPFRRVVTAFRNSVFAEAAASDLPGLIFTYVWDFGDAGSLAFVETLKDVFETQGHRTVFVELWASLEIRLERNRTEERLTAKPSKRDVDASSARMQAADQQYRLVSEGDFPFPDRYLRLDNSALSAADAAEQIVAYFDLPRVPEASA